MTDFRSLDPKTRAFALAGRFLQSWASMEWEIGAAIATALNVNKITEYILAQNLSFTKRIFVLRCLCQISHLPDIDKEFANKLLGAIQGTYGYRNNVAHDLFRPSDKHDGVEFMTVRARGKVSFPEANLSVADFNLMDIAIIMATQRLEELNKKLKAARRISPNAFLNLLSAIPDVPTQASPERGDPDHPSPPLPTPQMLATSLANLGKETETPPSEQE